jgi:hypothetical protein
MQTPHIRVEQNLSYNTAKFENETCRQMVGSPVSRGLTVHSLCKERDIMNEELNSM